MKPLIYGYLRVTDELADIDICRMERGLQDLADAEGFCFAITFYESVSGYHGAFSELLEELKRAEAHHIVTPSLDHLSRHPILRDQMLTRLERGANAQVWAVDDEDEPDPSGSAEHTPNRLDRTRSWSAVSTSASASTRW